MKRVVKSSQRDIKHAASYLSAAWRTLFTMLQLVIGTLAITPLIKHSAACRPMSDMGASGGVDTGASGGVGDCASGFDAGTCAHCADAGTATVNIGVGVGVDNDDGTGGPSMTMFSKLTSMSFMA